MTDQTMTQLIMQLAVAYPHKGDEIKPMLKLMTDKLSRYPLEVVELAVDEHISTSKYFPAISEMVMLCRKHQLSAKPTYTVDFSALREDLFEQTRLNGIDRQAWQELIKTARHMGLVENVLYLETKQKYIESYSWDVEKVKWTMAEMEAIAI